MASENEWTVWLDQLLDCVVVICVHVAIHDSIPVFFSFSLQKFLNTEKLKEE